jgi:DUF971 family protein
MQTRAPPGGRVYLGQREIAMAQPLAPLPIEVEVRSREEVLRVVWHDQHESVYPLTYLRGFCPCAACQGHAGAWNYVAIDHPTIKRIEEVGSYALNLVWSDGARDHTTGIYTFETLRELCPCPSCRETQGLSHPLCRMPEQLIPAALRR